ncbi:hypothetical protein RE476_10750 [Methanolobus mangrovi]|uniref:DUF11 domain-containing protein n=1 Tax=Methanolobus mangrovi TaxID=3072977 RepID=A0AA51YIS3_9EURY|nr:hypothetical protein [Methanolobus mangrovi]WMW21843.1 hypothetical protein RE476_10750 [Methanolobus mangrovi]
MPTKKLLSLSILLLILITPASAYGIREENIWIFQGSYELGIGERAYLEGFTIKIHDINVDNELSATLLVYGNSVFKEAFQVDAGVNNEHIYNSQLRINVLSIIQDKVSLEIYKQKSELVWVTDIPKTSFKIGDTLTGDEYKISLKDVNEDGALISVEYDGSKLEENYNSGDYQKFSDEFMINVVYLKKDTKEVFIETLKPGSPDIQLDSANVKDSYEPDDYVEYELLVTNNGTIPLHGMIVTTECDDCKVDGESQQYSILESGKQKKFIIKVKPQIEPMGKDITIISKVQGYDYRGNEYNSQIATEVNVKPYISIEKEIITRDKVSEKPEFGTEQYFQIIITLQNKANFQTAVSVTDKLPASFIPDDIDNTEWTVLLDAGSTETIEYFVSPTEPGDFKFMPATVAWKDGGETYILESETIDQPFHVSGSKVTVEKELSSSYMLVDEEIDIVIRISNEGDNMFKVSFMENIPDELTFIEGDSKWDGTLEPGDTREFTYSVHAERAGEYYLPQTELSITDENGKKESIVSAEPFLYIDDAIVENDDYIEESSYNELYDNSFENGEETAITDSGITRMEAAGFLTSSFIGLFLLIAAVPAFAYLYIIRIYK